MKGRLYIHCVDDKVWMRVENKDADIVCDLEMSHVNFSMALIGPSSQEVELRFPDNNKEDK